MDSSGNSSRSAELSSVGIATKVGSSSGGNNETGAARATTAVAGPELERLRIVDPACGTRALLLAMLREAVRHVIIAGPETDLRLLWIHLVDRDHRR